MDGAVVYWHVEEEEKNKSGGRKTTFNVRSTLLVNLNVYGIVDYRSDIIQQISKTYSSRITETSYPFPYPLSPWQPSFYTLLLCIILFKSFSNPVVRDLRLSEGEAREIFKEKVLSIWALKDGESRACITRRKACSKCGNSALDKERTCLHSSCW